MLQFTKKIELSQLFVLLRDFAAPTNCSLHKRNLTTFVKQHKKDISTESLTSSGGFSVADRNNIKKPKMSANE